MTVIGAPAIELAEAEAEPAAAAPKLTLAMASAPAPRLAVPTVQPTRRVLDWPGVRIVDASGAVSRGEPIRARLASLGWSAPRWALASAKVRDETVIRYPSTRLAVAQALARTLPGTVRLVTCDDGCVGLELIVGSDARAWRPVRQATANAPGKASA
jgi:hypothetical protein